MIQIAQHVKLVNKRTEPNRRNLLLQGSPFVKSRLFYVMTRPSSLQNVLEYSRMSQNKNVLEYSRMSWNILERLGILQNVLEYSRTPWKTLEYSRTSWKTLEYSRTSWKTLEDSGISQTLLEEWRSRLFLANLDYYSSQSQLLSFLVLALKFLTQPLSLISLFKQTFSL